MKRVMGFMCVLLLIIGLTGTANSTLNVISDDIFYDDVNMLYWWDDPGDFTGLDYATQGSAIDSLTRTVGTDLYDNWGRATQEQVDALIVTYLWSVDWLSVFDGVWVPIEGGHLLSATSISSTGFLGRDVTFGVKPGLQLSIDYPTLSVPDNTIGSWVVLDASPAPVPEPATMLLLGTGLVGLAGFGRKKFFKK